MSEEPATGAAIRVDGRAARALRTRRAIVEAHLALLREGDLRPTGDRIAERAGVSLRTLWTNFKDMETLFAATGRRLVELQLSAYRPIAVDLPLEARIDAFCRQRATMLEILAPAARASQTREPFSPQLQRNRALEIQRVRDEITTLFATEIRAARSDDTELMHALVAVSTYACWSQLRDHQGLEVSAACAVMAHLVTALFN